jgi:hypothetical protein
VPLQVWRCILVPPGRRDGDSVTSTDQPAAADFRRWKSRVIRIVALPASDDLRPITLDILGQLKAMAAGCVHGKVRSAAMISANCEPEKDVRAALPRGVRWRPGLIARPSG